MNIIFQDQYGRTHELTIKESKYGNGRLALVLLEHGSPFMTATINVPEIDLGEKEIVIKNYSENVGILQCLIDNHVVSEPLTSAQIGHMQCPIVHYRGLSDVEPNEVKEGSIVIIRGGGKFEVVFWNHDKATGVIENDEGTPISIGIEDIAKVIK